MIEPIQNRYDFVLFYDVKNGNPNGDPDAGNLPRIDPATSKGIVSDVCIKRKIRNYVDLLKGESIDELSTDKDAVGYKIYVQEHAVLNERHALAYDYTGIKLPKKANKPKTDDEVKALQDFLCRNFFDIRTFGAVMDTGDKRCGQVRGPVQLCFGESIDPVMPMDMSITRMAVTNAKDADKERTMGRKQYIPYGLYRMEGFVSASLAQRTGFDQSDLDLLWEALMRMFENDRSAARGLMTSRELVIFKHDSKLGNAPAAKLFDLVTVDRLVPDDREARSFSDYRINVDTDSLPQGVSVDIRA